MSESPSKLGTGLAWLGLIMMTTLVMIRTMVEHDAFPMWVSDPFVFSPPVIGLTPIKALILNLGVVLSCCTVLIGLFLRKEHFGTIAAILMTLGVAVIGYHGFNTFESIAEGSNLLAIIAVLYVASCAHKIGGAQQLIAAITLGFVVLLVVMGAYEMFVIHPNTIANYETTRDSFLAARGWTPGSFEALAYERRLHQAEPIAWFGLTNVFASFAGAGAAGLLTLGWTLRKTDRLSTVYLLAGLVAMGGLLMTGAKGGIGAFGLGIGLTAAAMLFSRNKLDGRAIAAMCGLVILGVIIRGLIGERLGELSLLFRSQYMVGSMKMFFENPLFGVGPGAFQEQYMIVKPALSPEDVASAHSIGFDLIAMLGIGGLALFAMLISIICRIRPQTVQTESTPTELLFERRQLVQITMLIIAIASVISIRFGSPAMDINLLMIQVLASGAWGGLAYLLIRKEGIEASLRWAMFSAAAVLSIHAMIEVTASWMVSGMLWALVIGNACTSVGGSLGTLKLKAHPRHVLGVVILAMLSSSAVFGLRLPSLAKWEQQLTLASRFGVNIAFQRQRPNELRSVKLDQLEFDGRTSAIEHLVEAAKIRPTHMPTRIAATHQMLWKASVLEHTNQHEMAVVQWEIAFELLEENIEHSTGAAGYYWLGSMWSGRAKLFPDDPMRDVWLRHAQNAWVLAVDRSPLNPQLALNLMNLAIERGLGDDISMWAHRALKLHEQSRLDPLRGLGDSDLMRVRRYAR
ncbi:MAG: O-antigen ligase family protein [Phycisphaerales bacterium]|nr:O-antigen ligase family protein [Phycisphaerales bacterium]